MDLALKLASEVQADLIVANDPDADRCAGRRADGAARRYRMLSGDQVGALLADFCLRRGLDGHVRGVDRQLGPARTPGRGVRPAVGADAHRLQVDRQDPRPRVRLRGGARLLRRARTSPATRTASPRSSPCSRWRPRSRLRAAPCSTGSTTSTASTACTPPASCRCASTTWRSSPGHAEAAIIASVETRLASMSRPLTTLRTGTADCRRPTASGSGSGRTHGSSAVRPAPSRSSSATSRWSCRSPTPSDAARDEAEALLASIKADLATALGLG